MSIYEAFAIAVALAMDAFAVSVSSAASFSKVTLRHYFRISFHFGLFQFFMPVIGWFLGQSVHSYIEAWDHWIAFVLLSGVGLNMLREALWGEDDHHAGDPSRGILLILLSTATSIDALAVGLSFSMAGVSVWMPAVIIGAVCAILSAAGIKLGSTLGNSDILGEKAAVVGALVLVGIGVKILHEHGVF